MHSFERQTQGFQPRQIRKVSKPPSVFDTLMSTLPWALRLSLIEPKREAAEEAGSW